MGKSLRICLVSRIRIFVFTSNTRKISFMLLIFARNWRIVRPRTYCTLTHLRTSLFKKFGSRLTQGGSLVTYISSYWTVFRTEIPKIPIKFKILPFRITDCNTDKYSKIPKNTDTFSSVPYYGTEKIKNFIGRYSVPYYRYEIKPTTDTEKIIPS